MIADKTKMEHDINVKRERKEKKEGRMRERKRGVEEERQKIASLCFSFD